MKYMGHKGRILNPITEAVGSLIERTSRIADPFCGSAIVSWHLSSVFPNPVWASDLQHFSCARAAAVIERCQPLPDAALENWLSSASGVLQHLSEHLSDVATALPLNWSESGARNLVFEHRQVAERMKWRDNSALPVMTRAYGGHYFSVSQAMIFDALRSTLPVAVGARNLAMSALVGAASRCSASPGHTAQPFQPTAGGSRWLLEGWRRSPERYVRSEWAHAESYTPLVRGRVAQGAAVDLIAQLREGAVACLDPPDSGVHYSRFYHVLETLTQGALVSVAGAGRYPPAELRPVSAFSQRSRAPAALEELLFTAADRGVRLVITFPFVQQSNGLSAEFIQSLAERYFGKVIVTEVESSFSSLGGRGVDRAARKLQCEAIISAF